MKRFLICALPHSGTGFMSGALQKFGVRAGHETIFKEWFAPEEPFDGDVSWKGLYHLPCPDEFTLIHLVRNPLHVTRSLLSNSVIQRHWSSERATVPHFCDLMPDPGENKRNDPAFVAETVVAMNRRIASFDPVLRVRVEEPDWEKLLRALGARFNPKKVKAANNAYRYPRRRSYQHLEWEDLPESLAIQARDYGYKVEIPA